MARPDVPAASLLFVPPIARDRDAEIAEGRSEVLVWFDTLAAGLRRYVRSFGIEADAADDIVQEVFVALFRLLQLGRPRQNLRGWLFRVAHHHALKHRQRHRRRTRGRRGLGRGAARARQRSVGRS